MKTAQSLPVAIIGAGPIGLAAAAHLRLRDHPFLLFEAGNSVGSNIISWKHIRTFSPWKYNIDKAAIQLLINSGWKAPDNEGLPTGEELYSLYLKPLAALPSINEHLFLQAKVISVGRKNIDKAKTTRRDESPYVLQVLHGNQIKLYEAKAVIDSSGTWSCPNPIGSGGSYAIGEAENRNKIFYGIPDILNQHIERYKNKNVLVVGSGHSSINAILELDTLKNNYPDTKIHWVLRKKHVRSIYGGQKDDALAARGALGTKVEEIVNGDRINVYTPFLIEQIINKLNKLVVVGSQDGRQFALPDIDEIICNTGSRPDFSFLREVRLSIDAALESVSEIADFIDPNVHSCGTVKPHGEKELRHPDKDFYIVGSKSYGRAPTFLMATGYEQVRSVVAAIDGDVEAARNVELNLPETGVCSSERSSLACCNIDHEKIVGALCC